jgi:hypothetical protein
LIKIQSILLTAYRSLLTTSMNQASENTLQNLQKRYRTTAIIILAQIFTALVLIAIAWFFPFNANSNIPPSSVTALWVAVIFIALGSFVLRRALFSWEKLKNTALLKGISGLIASLQMNAIILSAFGELIAIIGFVITVLSGNRFEMLRAGVVALIVFLINFPRQTIWEKIVANLEEFGI